MRKDMAKVIVERARRGSSNKNYRKGKKGYNKTLYKEGLDVVQKESMSRKRQFGYYAKQLNEHLTPLRRFLEKQIGRKWDDVFSEICENIQLNSAVRDHVFDFVATNVILVDGVPYHNHWYSYRNHAIEGMYVCPMTGILKEVQRKKRSKEQKKGVYIDGKCYMRMDSVWYELTLVKQEYIKENARTVFGKTTFYYTINRPKYHSILDDDLNRMCPVDRKQLNKREIKKLGLHKYDSEKYANYP